MPASAHNLTCLNAKGGFAGGYSLVRWERYLPDITNVTFIQLGANSGPGPHEPIYEYATRCGWTGLAFEPINSTFENLCRNCHARHSLERARATSLKHPLSFRTAPLSLSFVYRCGVPFSVPIASCGVQLQRCRYDGGHCAILPER